MDFIQFVSFYEIVKTGTFSGAAKSIFRSQSAVSHQIRNLEGELEVKLFERFGNKVKLTKEGEMLFDVMDAFFNDLDNLKRIYADIRQGQSGNLTIAITSSVMAYWFSSIIKKFIDKFPKIKFKLINCTTTRQMQPLVINREVDLGIGPKTSQLFSDRLNFLLWKSFDRGLVVSRSHPLCKKKTITLADITKYPLILFRKGTITREIVEEVFVRNKLSYEIIMEMDSSQNIMKFVEMDVGVSILSSFVITKQQNKDKLVFFNLAKLFGRSDYGIYCMRDKYITTAIKEFINFIAPALLDQLPSYTVRRV